MYSMQHKSESPGTLNLQFPLRMPAISVSLKIQNCMRCGNRRTLIRQKVSGDSPVAARPEVRERVGASTVHCAVKLTFARDGGGRA